MLLQPGPALRAIQRAWDYSICVMRVKAVLEGAVESGRARLLATRSLIFLFVVELSANSPKFV